MALYPQVWKNIEVLIFGPLQKTYLAIKTHIEKEASPLSIQLEHITHFEEAFRHCKNTKNVGFIFLIEPESDPDKLIHSFHELCQPYETRGFPCFGVLLYQDQKTILGYQIKEACPHIIHYLSIEQFMHPKNASLTLKLLWKRYYKAFEAYILPERLQESIIETAEGLDAEDLHFLDRVSLLISSEFNSSWLDQFALRWTPLVYSIPFNHQKFLNPHQNLRQILQIQEFKNALTFSIEEIGHQTHISTWIKIGAISWKLNQMKKSGTLQSQMLQFEKKFQKVETPSFLKKFSQIGKNILIIAQQESRAHQKAV